MEREKNERQNIEHHWSHGIHLHHPVLHLLFSVGLSNMKKTTFERIWCRPDDLPYLLTILFETNDIDRVEVEPASSGVTYIVTAYREEE